jgi:hypothetical protein
MSLTQAQRVFASVHESALNDLLMAFFNARPRYLRYGSPAFVAATSSSATQMAAISFPGLPGGIDWAVRFSTPRIDLYKQTDALPPQLALPPGGFSLRTDVELCVNCVTRRDDRKNDNHDKPDDKKPGAQVSCTRLQVFAIGHMDNWVDGNGNGEIRFRVDAVELVDITPNSLESVLECLIRMLLDAALSQVHLPLQALRAGAFQLTVTQGPLIDDDHVLARGNV